MTDTSKDLRERCSEAFKTGLPSGQVWLLIVEHERYKKLVQSCAKNAVRRSPLPWDWWEDVADEAIIRLTKRLSKDVYLEVDPDQTDQGFLPRLATVTRDLCKQAVRNEIRKSAKQESEVNVEGLQANAAPSDVFIDFGSALSQLNDRQRLAIVMRFFERRTTQQVADEMGLTHRQAEYAVKQALERLRRLMPPPDDVDE